MFDNLVLLCIIIIDLPNSCLNKHRSLSCEKYYCRNVVKSFIQGFLPGIALKIFLILLPMILMTMSKVEGFTSLSKLERRSASKYYLFLLVNVFLGSLTIGTAFQQLDSFIHQSASEYVSLFHSSSL